MNQQIEDALNTIVKLTDQSGNMKKELKKAIHETVINLRNLTFILKDSMNKRTSENSQLQKGIEELKKEMEVYKYLRTAGQVAPSTGSTSILTSGGNKVTQHGVHRETYTC